MRLLRARRSALVPGPRGPLAQSGSYGERNLLGVEWVTPVVLGSALGIGSRPLVIRVCRPRVLADQSDQTAIRLVGRLDRAANLTSHVLPVEGGGMIAEVSEKIHVDAGADSADDMSRSRGRNRCVESQCQPGESLGLFRRSLSQFLREL